MIDGIMAKLSYTDPPEYKTYSSYRGYLQKVANYTCAYCTLTESESPGATFNIEHFRPQKLFPKLAVECKNLRYACPRCNSYKGDLWITTAAGCSRTCTECTLKICKSNTYRFVDPLAEDPTTLFYMGDDDRIYAYPESKPADYTIKYLRLNRAQLIKLRYVRRFMDSWLSELADKRRKAIESLNEIKTKQHAFSDTTEGGSGNSVYTGMIATMYEMMVLQAEQSVLLIDEEMQKLQYLLELRAGHDATVAEN